MKSNYVLFFAILTSSLTAFAQGQSGVGGGNWTEAKIKNQMQDMIPYLNSQQGQLDFEEIVKYNKAHPEETFDQIIRYTNPVLIDGPKQQKFDKERDCRAHIEVGNRYFECNANALPELTHDNAPDFSRFWFHEALVQVGLEKDMGPNVPSTYTISSRLEFHLETFQKWMPGKEEQSHNPDWIAKLDTIVTKCTITEATMNWGLRIAMNEKTQPVSVEIYQADPRLSAWRKHDGDHGLKAIEDSLIMNSPFQADTGYIPATGLLNSATSWASEGNVYKILSGAEDRRSSFEVTNLNMLQLARAKKFKAKLSVYVNSGDYASAQLDCVNVLN